MKKTGDKYAIQPRDAGTTWLAGLYQIEEINGFRYPTFVVLSRKPCDAVSEIHDRMPVILPESKINEWIAPDGEPDRVAKTALTDLVVKKV